MGKRLIPLAFQIEVPDDSYDWHVDIDGRLEKMMDHILVNDEHVSMIQGPTSPVQPPRLDVLAFRDPDGDTDVRIYLNGVAAGGADYSFDPGAGRQLDEVRANAYDALNNPETPGYLRGDIHEGYCLEQDGGYTDSNMAVECSICKDEVTAYPTGYVSEDIKGYLDSDFSMTAHDGHTHVVGDEGIPPEAVADGHRYVMGEVNAYCPRCSELASEREGRSITSLSCDFDTNA